MKKVMLEKFEEDEERFNQREKRKEFNTTHRDAILKAAKNVSYGF